MHLDLAWALGRRSNLCDNISGMKGVESPVEIYSIYSKKRNGFIAACEIREESHLALLKNALAGVQ